MSSMARKPGRPGYRTAARRNGLALIVECRMRRDGCTPEVACRGIAGSDALEGLAEVGMFAELARCSGSAEREERMRLRACPGAGNLCGLEGSEGGYTHSSLP